MGNKKVCKLHRTLSSEYGSRRTIRRLARNSALLYSVDKRLPDLMVPKSPDSRHLSEILEETGGGGEKEREEDRVEFQPSEF